MRFLAAIVVLLPFLTFSQVGGGVGYQILNLTSNARTAALGGTAISINDSDLSQFFENPATADSILSGDIFFNVNPYFADLTVFSGAYSFNVKEAGPFAVGLTYLDYNAFEMTDATGVVLGNFNAQDYALTIGKAHRLGPFTLGMNLKLVHTSIDVFGSTALLADVGGTFQASRNFTIAMTFSNMGGRISDFDGLAQPDVPFDVKIGTTFKPEYMPLRFTLTSTNLTEENSILAGEQEGRTNNGVEKVLRRVNIGAELLLSENFQVLLGYNHKRKQELKLDETAKGAGFSYGFMLNIKQIMLRFSRATYHAAGGSSFISLQTNLNRFKKIL